jgi:hypothetical protein
VAEPPDEDNRSIEMLEAELKRLEAEYNMYFAGRLPRPPLETRARVDRLFKRLDREQHQGNYAARFRFTTLQTRYSKFIDLWDRALRAREEGRPGPFAHPKAPVESRRPAADRIVYVATLSDPMREMDKVEEMYERLTQARQEAGQDDAPLPFHKFVDLVRTQLGSLRGKGTEQVAFRVAMKDGKVAFTARALRGAANSEE